MSFDKFRFPQIQRLNFLAAALAFLLPAAALAQAPLPPNASAGQMGIAQQLKTLVIDKVNFDKLDVATVIDFLAAKSKEIDPAHQGINFVLRLPPADSPAAASLNIHRQVSMTLENVPIDAILRYVAEQTNLAFTVEDYAVYIRPALESGNASASAAPPVAGAVSVRLDTTPVSLNFNNATIDEATRFLSITAKQLDPAHRPLNFVIMPDATTNALPVTLALNNVPMSEALRYICLLANVKNKVQEDAVEIVPGG